MSDSKIISVLLFKYLQGTLTPDEEQQLSGWKQASPANLAFFRELEKEAAGKSKLAGGRITNQELEKRIFDKVTSQIPELRQRTVSLYSNWWKYSVAAVIVLSLGTGAFLRLNNRPGRLRASISRTTVPQDVAPPAGNYASITLSSGEQVDLRSAANGTLASQGKVQLVKLADGQIAYKAVPGTGSQELQYNTLTNPKGSKVINIQLADGTIVWLNAGSSLTFPVAFLGKERKVSITGEAYFDVAANKAMPFKISRGEMEILVLGTSFNVNAYSDEPEVKVTLLNGSVKICNGNVNGILKPGEQANVKNGGISVQPDIDVDKVMAWKNGYFSFDRADVQTVMRQVSRWYNVEVKYEGDIPDENFGGDLRRNSTLSSVLKILEKSGVKFHLQGGTVTVFK